MEKSTYADQLRIGLAVQLPPQHVETPHQQESHPALWLSALRPELFTLARPRRRWLANPQRQKVRPVLSPRLPHPSK